jgi:predicted amidophosphoribosyltransferase
LLSFKALIKENTLAKKIFPIKNSLLHKFFPHWCYFCRQIFQGQTNVSICPQCFDLLPWWDEQFCANCNQPKIACQACKTQPKITAIFSYQSPIRNLVVSMKYSKNFYAARMLKIIVKNWVEAHISKNEYDFILPAPIHWRRFFARNFNSAEYLLPSVWEKILANRVLHSAPQTSLPPYKRKKLFGKRVFQIPDLNIFRRKKILIFDDVITTKSTVLNLAKEMKKAKPEKIAIFCLARSITK